jgi:hypothetical protein
VTILTSAGPELAGPTARNATQCLIYAACLPFIAYVAFLLISLLLDLCRAILSLPGKSEMSQNGEEKR